MSHLDRENSDLSDLEIEIERLRETNAEMLFWIKRMRNMIEAPNQFHDDAYFEMYADVDALIAKVVGAT